MFVLASTLAGLVNERFGSYRSRAVFLMQCGQATESRQILLSSVREAVLFKMQIWEARDDPYRGEAISLRYVWQKVCRSRALEKALSRALRRKTIPM